MRDKTMCFSYGVGINLQPYFSKGCMVAGFRVFGTRHGKEWERARSGVVDQEDCHGSNNADDELIGLSRVLLCSPGL